MYISLNHVRDPFIPRGPVRVEVRSVLVFMTAITQRFQIIRIERFPALANRLAMVNQLRRIAPPFGRASLA